MNKLDDILQNLNREAAHIGGNEDQLESEQLQAFKQQIKTFMLEIIKEEQKNWDDKDDQAMWGYQALDRLSETVEEL